MKYRDLAAKLRELGWYFDREGGNHEIWTNGKEQTQVPRHREINELLARKILKMAERFKRENR